MIIRTMVLLSCMLAGCKSTDKSVAADQTQEAELVAEFEKTGCRGYCPKYTLQIYSDRRLVFSGERNVASLAKVERTLDDQEWQNTMQMLASSEVSDLDSIYDNGVVDAPFFHLRIANPSSLRTVSCRGDAPKAFTKVEQHLERMAQKQSWLEVELETEKEMILLLQEEDAVARIEEKYNQIGMELVKRISPRQLYFVFRVVPGDHTEMEVMELLEADPEIKSVQWNRQINRRDR